MSNVSNFSLLRFDIYLAYMRLRLLLWTESVAALRSVHPNGSKTFSTSTVDHNRGTAGAPKRLIIKMHQKFRIFYVDTYALFSPNRQQSDGRHQNVGGVSNVIIRSLACQKDDSPKQRTRHKKGKILHPSQSDSRLTKQHNR